MQLSPFALIDALRAPPPEPARVAWLAGKEYAHRGLHDDVVPENSPAAFAGAIARGMGIECDVQKTADGRAMVFHDWELDRLTDQTGPTGARTVAELEQFTLLGSAEHIPLLDRVLDQVAGQVPLIIEIKSKRDRKVSPLCLAVLRALEGYRGDHAVMSFDPRVGRWFSVHAPQTVRGLVVTEEDKRGLYGTAERHMALWHARPDFIAYDVRDLPSRFAAAQRARGLPVLTWTVRTAELRERAAVHADAPISEGEGVA
ncbi:glycerophosphodiester phosphodiesterase [Tsuneonella flava]|uniref:Glycerophosphodiester phosphodiesterase n=1 Tax=Tsuneonella flava TaxID=2055955 RepID=A0ABX7K9G6_9SPHN|nr:glycerophosphodiester phosphodiesterase family protein [Tsuneonella flava]QSB44903.1 glycerophosphodiester phosphodiesterase [Tsuneonella flava]